MNKTRCRRQRLAALTMSIITLLILAGCHYSLLNRGSSLAAWSPDGNLLAVCIENSASESGELWLVEPQSGSTRKLLTSELSNGLPHLLAPRWAPDGETLYCARTTADEKDERRTAAIIAIDVATGMATDAGVIHYKNARGEHFSSTEAFIPLDDGTLAAQDLGQDQIYRLVRIDPATGVTSSFAPPTGNWLVINGSRDGRQVAVATPGGPGAGTRVAVFNSSGEQHPNHLELWPTGDDMEKQPVLTWSPTATQLAVIVEDIPPAGSRWSRPSSGSSGPSEAEDAATLIVLEPHTGRTALIADDLFGIPPVYSPDGRHLAYSASSGIRDGDGELLLEIRILTDFTDEAKVSLPGLALPLAWSADSSMLAYYLGLPDDDNTGTVISVAPDSSGTRVVSQRQQDRLAVAAPTGGRLAWVSGDGAVQVIDPATGRIIFHQGLTVAGTIQAGEDHLRQARPGDALESWSGLVETDMSSDGAARLAAGSYAALRALDRHGDAARGLDQSCIDLARTEEPATAFLHLCGALSDYGFRPEAERLVEEQLLARYPDSEEAVEALWALTALKQTEGDWDAAQRHLERLLHTYPPERKEITRALLLAALAEKGGDPAAVLELAGLIIEANGDEEDPDQAATRRVAHYARGQALEQQGDRGEARMAYADALDHHAEIHLADGRLVADLCWEALFRLTRSENPAARL